MFETLLEEIQRVNEVNIPARLAADDFLSSFSDAYKTWEESYRSRLDIEEFRLARKMIVDMLKQGIQTVVKRGRRV